MEFSTVSVEEIDSQNVSENSKNWPHYGNEKKKKTQILHEISVLIHVNRLRGPGEEPLVWCKVMSWNTEIYLERIKYRNVEQESTYTKWLCAIIWEYQ